jgi:hypothetical protein
MDPLNQSISTASKTQVEGIINVINESIRILADAEHKRDLRAIDRVQEKVVFAQNLLLKPFGLIQKRDGQVLTTDDRHAAVTDYEITQMIPNPRDRSMLDAVKRAFRCLDTVKIMHRSKAQNELEAWIHARKACVEAGKCVVDRQKEIQNHRDYNETQQVFRPWMKRSPALQSLSRKHYPKLGNPENASSSES